MTRVDRVKVHGRERLGLFLIRVFVRVAVVESAFDEDVFEGRFYAFWRWWQGPLHRPLHGFVYDRIRPEGYSLAPRVLER